MRDFPIKVELFTYNNITHGLQFIAVKIDELLYWERVR
jgi:hypothetical protein